jgi:hypothetical protein
MASKPKLCRVCGKAGAYSFNSLCHYHWEKLIEVNIKKHVEEKKKDAF